MQSRIFALVPVVFALMLLMAACSSLSQGSMQASRDFEDVVTLEPMDQEPNKPLRSSSVSAENNFSITSGSDTYKGMSVDNVLHTSQLGDIHFSLYVPDTYNASNAVPLFITLPGYQGLYFQGVGSNIYSEDFAFTAREYEKDMIIAAPQLDDWHQMSADKTIALTEYLLAEYNIDQKRVYLEGYSGGGETLSLVMGTRPDLYAAALLCASQWDGDLQMLADARVPVRLSVGESDEYYGSKPAVEAAEKLYDLYKTAGLSEEEINRLVVLDIKPSSYFSDKGAINQHGGGCAIMAHDPDVLGWLFAQ